MIIPKKEGCCDDQILLQQQQQSLPCCENLMALYPPGPRSRCRRRRRFSPRRGRFSPRRGRFSPPRCRFSPRMWGRRSPTQQIIKVPFPITKVKYLDPIRVPDLILPPVPPPPPRRPRQMMMGGMGGGGWGGGGMGGGGNYCNCQETNNPRYDCVCKKC